MQYRAKNGNVYSGLISYICTTKGAELEQQSTPPSSRIKAPHKDLIAIFLNNLGYTRTRARENG